MTLPDAFNGVLTALSGLAGSRGHVMGAVLRDDPLSAAMQCTRCQRWVVFTIPVSSISPDPAELRGDALGRCTGTPHKPVSSGDNGLRSMALADGTMR